MDIKILRQIEMLTSEKVSDVTEYIKEFIIDEYYPNIEEKEYKVTQIFNEYDWTEIEYKVKVSNITRYDDNSINDFDIEVLNVKKL